MRTGNKSVMSSQAHFALEPTNPIQRSKFDRSSGLKTTIQADYLYPFYCDEVIPGDTHIMSVSTFARMATQIYPFMDNMNADIQFFFVPMRLVWDNWEKFMGAQDNPGDSTAYTIPVLDFTSYPGFGVGSIYDYMGLPTNVVLDNTYPVSALPFRCIDLIYNEWYRDENLQNSLVVATDDGPDDPATYVLRKRGKRKDYFTSCLPFPQKGNAPQIPVHGSSDIYLSGSSPYPLPKYTKADGTALASGALSVNGFGNMTDTGGAGAIMDPNGSLEANADASRLNNAGSLYSLVNDIRTGFQIQKLLERDARGGTRYVEMLKAHYNVISPDFRLQRPEFLGQATTRINISPVPQTSQSPGTPSLTDTPQANLSSYGTFAHNDHIFSKSFVEHGYIIGFISIRADLTYQNGLDRMYLRRTRFDFQNPVFNHLGEQIVESMELDCTGVSGTDRLVFGYQARYDDYRYKISRIGSIFKSNAAGSLDAWHLAEDFVTAPVLNASFIESNTPVDRVIAIPSQPHFLLDTYFKLTSIRPMPVYSIPGYVDHF